MTLKWTIWTSLHSIIFKFNGLQIRSCATSSCRHRPPPHSRFVPLVLSSPHTYYHLQEASWELIHWGNGSQWGGLEAGLWWRGRSACIQKKKKMNEERSKVSRRKEGEVVEVQLFEAAGFDSHLLRGLLWSDPGLGDSLRLSREGKEQGNPAWLAQAWVYLPVVVLVSSPKILALRQRNPQEVKCWRITEAVKASAFCIWFCIWLLALGIFFFFFLVLVTVCNYGLSNPNPNSDSCKKAPNKYKGSLVHSTSLYIYRICMLTKDRICQTHNLCMD